MWRNYLSPLMRGSPRLRCSVGCLLSQLSLGFKFDQLHKIFNDQIALEFFAFLFGKRAVTLGMDELICSFSYLGRGMESNDLFRSWMIHEKLCNFSSGLCFEKHSHFLLLQKRMSHSNSLNGSFLTIHQEHTIEETVLQKHCEDAWPDGKSYFTAFSRKSRIEWCEGEKNVLLSSALAHYILAGGDIREGQGIQVTSRLWV